MPEDRSTSPHVGERSPLDDAPIVVHGPVHGAGSLPATSQPLRPTGSQPQSGSAGPTARPLVPSLDPGVPAAAEPSTTEPRRALSLDALRGFFLILMTFSFTTHTGLLPGWLYHVQTPPPDFKLLTTPGIGWPDLAYPAFIFAMAAAIPIALTRRIESDETEIGIILGAIRRFFMLFVFALLIGHSNTYFVGYTQTGRALAVLGFVIMFAMFVQRRRDWSERTTTMVNRAGWIAAALFLALSPLTYGSTFSPARRDEIIAYLAVSSLVGSVLWYFTRNKWGVRLAALAAVVALYLGARGEGWIQGWWWTSPAPWLFRPTDLGLMTVVIPGTIAGDLLLRWMRAPSTGPGIGGGVGIGTGRVWSAWKMSALAALGPLLMVVVVTGLYHRWVQETTLIAALLCLGGAVLVWRPTTATENLMRDLFGWGAVWLLVGLFLDPAEGGIKKVPDTLSYFFTVTGLTTMLLVTLVAVFDGLGRGRPIAALVDVGRNPMLCYVLYTVFLNSLLEMVPPLRGVLRDSAGGELLRAVITTGLVVLAVRAFSRQRIFWRT